MIYLAQLLILVTFACSTFAAIPALTNKEKTAVNKLRAVIGNRMVSEYMKTDHYLLKWVKAKNFDITQAKNALEKTLQWRKEIGADGLPFRDLTDFKRNFVIDFTTSKDKNGKTVTLIPFGDWNIRKKAIEGKIDELALWLDAMEEKSAQLSYNSTGDSTSFLIGDINGFSLRKHACAGCSPFYLNWVRHHELHYPYNFYKIYVINAPAIFEPITNLMRPLMTAATRDAFRVFGYDKDEWRKKVLETVDPAQLPVRFGGTKKQKA